MGKKCDCEFCRLHKLRNIAMRSNDIEVVRKAMIEFSDLWLMVDFDRNYLSAILDGSWPDAVGILQAALESAQKEAPKDERPE